MAIKFYMDVHIPKVITTGLRVRNVDVLTAQEDGTSEYEDDKLLTRAGQLNRVLFSFDIDIVSEAVKCQRKNIPFVCQGCGGE